jgi:hypothetical protein
MRLLKLREERTGGRSVSELEGLGDLKYGAEAIH